MKLQEYIKELNYRIEVTSKYIQERSFLLGNTSSKSTDYKLIKENLDKKQNTLKQYKKDLERAKKAKALIVLKEDYSILEGFNDIGLASEEYQLLNPRKYYLVVE